MNATTIGKQIAQMRREKGVTQEELAKHVGVSTQAVSKWERGLSFPDVDTIHALAGILHCKAESLINGSDIEILSSFREISPLPPFLLPWITPPSML